MKFILLYSKCSPKYAENLEIWLPCIINCDENLSYLSFSTSVASEGHSVSGLIGTSLLPIFVPDVFFLNSISFCCCCLKNLSVLSNLACSLVSKIFSEDAVSEVRVTPSFSMRSYEKLFDVAFVSLLKWFSYFVAIKMGSAIDGVY